MVENTIFDKLNTLNNIYLQSLPQIQHYEKIDSIKTSLFSHQINMVHGMHHHRDKLTRGFMSDNQAINGKIGIIADSPGTGKTLSVLAYIASATSFPKITCELTNHSTKYFYSHDIHNVSDQIANLIIVPHYLYQQCNQEIRKHTTMKYSSIETKRLLKGTEFAKTILESQFVLTTNKCFPFLQEYATLHNIQWNNIFVDEASAIYMKSSDPALNFQFLWFITNNWIPLIFKNPSISKNDFYHLRDRVQLHSDLEEWLLDNKIPHFESNLVSSAYFKDYLPFFHRKKYFIILRNTNNCIKKSISLPLCIKEEYQCRPNMTLQSLGSYLSRNSSSYHIPIERIPYLLQVLNIDCKNVYDYLGTRPSSFHNLIRKKANENECTICLENADYPIITNCCYNIYCGKCILTNMIVNKKCPTCRELLGTNNISCLRELSKEDNVYLKNKTEICLNILQQYKNGKFIIYSSFDNIYYQLFEEIDKLGFKAERMENNLFSILRTCKNYQEGKTNILFVSNIDLIRGLSFNSTSHLIFYHEPSFYEWKQILIHSAQRIGRQESLNLIHLNSELQV